MTDQKTLEFSNMFWAYRAVVKQTGGGGGIAALSITANERFVLLYGITGRDDYAAGRSVNAQILDSGDEVIANAIIAEAGLDNVRVPIPSTDPTPESTANQFQNRIVMGSTDVIKISMATLATNEELTVVVRGLIGSKPPTVTTTGSTGTVTLTEDYNKVI